MASKQRNRGSLKSSIKVNALVEHVSRAGVHHVHCIEAYFLRWNAETCNPELQLEKKAKPNEGRAQNNQKFEKRERRVVYNSCTATIE